jgi:DNA-binding transcriptional regulator LsrR (DeoR family)
LDKENVPTIDQKRLEMIADVARLYYEEQKNVKEIAALFETSPSSVSRLLKEAKDREIVQIVIRYPFLTVPSLGQQLRKHLGLKEAYVLPEFRGSYPDLIQRVGQLAARVLEEHLQDGMTFGISLGMAVGATAQAFTMPRNIVCTVVRLHGASDDEIGENKNLGQTISSQIGNQYKSIPSPLYLQNKEACQIIRSEPIVQDVLRIAEEADIALVGIGSMNNSVSTLVKNRVQTDEELMELAKAGAVGEVCGKYFDINGDAMDVDFNHRTVSIDIKMLNHIKYVIGVAAGPGKVEPILGAIHGGLINILVTDEETASLLIQSQMPKTPLKNKRERNA